MKKKFDQAYYKQIGQNVKKEIKRQHRTGREIARYIELTDANFSNKIHGIQMFTVWELEGIATRLQVPITQLLQKERSNGK